MKWISHLSLLRHFRYQISTSSAECSIKTEVSPQNELPGMNQYICAPISKKTLVPSSIWLLCCEKIHRLMEMTIPNQMYPKFVTHVSKHRFCSNSEPPHFLIMPTSSIFMFAQCLCSFESILITSHLQFSKQLFQPIINSCSVNVLYTYIYIAIIIIHCSYTSNLFKCSFVVIYIILLYSIYIFVDID